MRRGPFKPGLAIQEALQRLNAEGSRVLRARVGIHTGRP